MNEAQASKNPISAPLDMDEPTLRKLSRAQLQKLAKEHKVKANMKSEVIIRELVKLCKVVPLLQDEESVEPPRTREESPLVAGCSTGITDLLVETSLNHPVIQEDSPSSGLRLTADNTTPIIAAQDAASIATENLVGQSQGLPPALQTLTGLTAEISDSGSDLSYASPGQQEYYNSPVSSRAGTPPLEEPIMLKRAVSMMNRITAYDQRALAEIAALRATAATLREDARKARDVVRAERGRRVRLEAYFTYWKEIAPEWPKEWIYEEGEEERIRTEKVLRQMTPPLPSAGPSGPPTLPFDKRDAPLRMRG